jgi:aspartyl aminopeptidase
MDNRILSLKNFLDASVSVYHAIDQLRQVFDNAGYTRLSESETWNLVPGGKYYMTRSGTAIMAFRVPQGNPKGFMLSASHSDRPCFKVKENCELKGNYTRMAVERYGGMLIAPWLDRPLSIAGRVLVETENGAQMKLVNIDRDLLLMPNVAIHMNRQANEGYKWNPAVDTLPLMGGKEAAGKLDALLTEAAGGKVLGHDLYLYIRQQAKIWGLENEYISSAALDDLACAWLCTQGFLKATDSEAIPVLCVFDNEEVGSSSLQGADSDLLGLLLQRICGSLNLKLENMLSQSFMLSADNAHAIHPNHPEFADPNNAPVVNKGVVLKFNANQRYTTDGVSAAIFRKICGKANAPVQTYCNRADLPGGSTLGNISLTHVSVQSADIGLPQLAMHSCYETAGVQDAIWMEEILTAYYSTALEVKDGNYTLK